MALEITDRVIQLTGLQVIRIHGWLRPIPYLSWDHVVADRGITFASLVGMGIPVQDLHFLQQDVQQWISRKGVSFQDVPAMIMWPLHPLHDLKGDLSHFLEQKYSADVLSRLGITFRVLRDELGMREDHMSMMNLSVQDWKLLGMQRGDVECISKTGCKRIFGWDYVDLVHSWGGSR